MQVTQYCWRCKNEHAKVLTTPTNHVWLKPASTHSISFLMETFHTFLEDQACQDEILKNDTVNNAVLPFWHKERMCSHLGSGGPSDRGFMDSLQSERKTRKASFWRMWENFAPGGWPGAAPDSYGEATKKNNLKQLATSIPDFHIHQPAKHKKVFNQKPPCLLRPWLVTSKPHSLKCWQPFSII